MGEQESFLAFWGVFVGRLEGQGSSSGQFRAQLDKAKALARQLAPQLGKVRYVRPPSHPVLRVSDRRRCLWQTNTRVQGMASAVVHGGPPRSCAGAHASRRRAFCGARLWSLPSRASSTWRPCPSTRQAR